MSRRQQNKKNNKRAVKPSAKPLSHFHNHKQDNDTPALSRRHSEVIRFVRDGRAPEDLPFPELATRMISGSYASATLISVPNNLPRATLRSRARDVRVVVGTAGVGWLIVQPQWAPLNDCDAFFATTSAYTGSTFPTAGAVGLTNTEIDDASPYDTTNNPLVWTAYCQIAMKVNSAAMLNKQGRVLMGITNTEVQGGNTPLQIEALQTFQTWGVDQLTEKNMPLIKWIPQSHASWPSAPISPTTTFPGIVICLDGMTSGTILEFTMSYTSVVTGARAPWDRKLVIDTDAFMGPVASMLVTAKKGFSHREEQERQVVVSHVKEATHQAVKKQTLLGRIVDVGREFVEKTPIGKAIRGALGFARNIFEKWL